MIQLSVNDGSVKSRRVAPRSTAQVSIQSCAERLDLKQISGDKAVQVLGSESSEKLGLRKMQVGNHPGGNLKHRRLEILAQMFEGRCAGNQQDIGRALEKPGKRNLHRCGPKRRCGCVKHRRL